MAGQAWTVRELVVNRKKSMEAPAGSQVEVETPFVFTVGDSIYKVSSKEAFTLSDSACQRRLEGASGDKLPCRLTVTLEGEQLRIVADVSGCRHDVSFPVGPLEPSRSGDMERVLAGQFSKCGDTPFRLESLEAPGFPPVLIPMSLFKDLRRRFYGELAEAITAAFREQITVARRGAVADVKEMSSVTPRHPSRERLFIVVPDTKEWRFPLQNGADAVIIPLSRAVIHQLSTATSRMRGAEGEITWQVPFMLFDRDIPLYRETIRTLHQHGFRHFEAANLSHFHLFKGLDSLHISTWHRCFTLNSQALAAWRELGAEAVTLYLEDDSGNIGELLKADGVAEMRVVAYSPLPVMTTKIRIKDVHANTPLRSDRGETYRVTSHDGLQTITSTLPFSLTARRGELTQKGCHSFILDLSEEPRERWTDILAALRGGREIAGATEFNYGSGLI